MRCDRVAADPAQCKLRTRVDWMTVDIYRLAAIGLVAESRLATNVLIRSDRRIEGEERKESAMPKPTTDNRTGKGRY